MGFRHTKILPKQFRQVHWYGITNQKVPNFFVTYKICVMFRLVIVDDINVNATTFESQVFHSIIVNMIFM